MSDVAELREMARAATRLASQLDANAAKLDRAQHVEYESRGAAVYRQHLSDREREARDAAEAMRSAATALLAHAHAVEQRIEQLRRIEHWFETRLHEAHGVLNHVASLAHDAVDAVTSRGADDARRILDAARHAPAPGSPDWERFASRLPR